MKKIFIGVLSLFAICGLASCGETQGPTQTPTGGEPTGPVVPTDFMSIDEVIQMAKNNTSSNGGNGGSGAVTGTPNFNVPDGGYDGSKQKVVFYHTMGANLREVLDAYIVEFNKLYPNITIEHKQVGSYDDVRTQISTELTVGAQPNVAYCYPDHVALYNLAGAVTHLDKLIDSNIEVTRADGSKEVLGLTQAQKDDFIAGYYNEGKQFGDGLMYTMPLSKSTEVLYYNKTFFDTHNIPLPTHWFSEGADDTTSMEYVCQKVVEADPYSIPLGYDSESNLFITMCEQIGSPYTSATGEHFLFDNEPNKAVLNKFRGWYKDQLMTTQELYGAYTSDLFTSADNPKSYMSIGSSAGASHQRPGKVDGAYPFEVGICPIPQMNPANPKVISQGPSLCIFNDSNPQEVIASWLFVKFLTTCVEFQAEFSMASGYVPVLKSVGDNEIYKTDFLDFADGGDYVTALSVKVCLEQQNAYYTSPAFNGSSVAREEVGYLVSKVLSMTTDKPYADVSKAFDEAVANCKSKS